MCDRISHPIVGAQRRASGVKAPPDTTWDVTRSRKCLSKFHCHHTLAPVREVMQKARVAVPVRCNIRMMGQCVCRMRHRTRVAHGGSMCVRNKRRAHTHTHTRHLSSHTRTHTHSHNTTQSVALRESMRGVCNDKPHADGQRVLLSHACAADECCSTGQQPGPHRHTAGHLTSVRCKCDLLTPFLRMQPLNYSR